MRGSIIGAGAVLSLIGVSCECAPVPSGPPVIEFVSHEIDLGEIEITSRGRDIEYMFQNRGLAALKISRAVSSCGCTIASIESRDVEAGGCGKIIARIAPTQSEKRTATVTVYSNDPRQPAIPLRLSWIAVAPLDLVPSSVDLGILRPGSHISRTIDLVWRCHDNDCRVLKLEPFPSAEVEADLGESGETDEGVPKRCLRLIVTPGIEPGERSGRVVVQLNGCWKEEITVPIHWRVQDVIEVRPTRVFVGGGGPGTLRENGFDLVSTGGRVTVSDVTVDDPDAGIEYEVERARDEREITRVRVSWYLPKTAGFHTRTIRVKCTEPVPREFDVPISAIVSNAR